MFSEDTVQPMINTLQDCNNNKKSQHLCNTLRVPGTTLARGSLMSSSLGFWEVNMTVILHTLQAGKTRQEVTQSRPRSLVLRSGLSRSLLCPMSRSGERGAAQAHTALVGALGLGVYCIQFKGKQIP